MKILHINKFLYRRGGAESYMFDVGGLQERHGHTVDFWGMEHPQNDPNTFADKLVSEVDFGGDSAGLADQVRMIGRMVWSTSAQRKLGEVLEAYRPDVIHAHNIYHQLSPSILRAATKANVPVVLTMHDYKLVCPNYQLLAGGEVCERCVNGGVHNALIQRCNKDSLGASVAVTLESGLHRATKAYSSVSTLIAPSKFMADTVGKSGRFSNISHIPHFTELDRPQADPATSNRVFFAGRLSSEKGIGVLVDAVRMLSERNVDIGLDIAGDGPEQERLQALAADLDNITFHGRLDKQGVNELFVSSAALVVPSTWHENQPMVILEAIAAGLPVVASDIGGISELVRDGETGALVPPGDATALANALESLLAAPESRTAMGKKARSLAQKDFGAAVHLDALDRTYDDAQVRISS